jgi:hypothetical protein
MAAAQPRTAGVSVGDWFKYGSIAATWYSSDPNAKPPAFVEGYNGIQCIFLNVTAIEDTTIIGQFTFHYKNGTESSESGGWVDIDTGDGNLNGWIVSSNLYAGQTVYNSASSYLTINETINRLYPNSPRETNHVNTNLPFNATGYSYSQDYYWDRTTGILLENHFADNNQTGAYPVSSSIDLRITDSSVWTIPEFPTWTATAVIFAALTLAVFAVQRRSGRKNQTEAGKICARAILQKFATIIIRLLSKDTIGRRTSDSPAYRVSLHSSRRSSPKHYARICIVSDSETPAVAPWHVHDNLVSLFLKATNYLLRYASFCMHHPRVGRVRPERPLKMS